QIYLYKYKGGSLASSNYNWDAGYIRGVVDINHEGPIIWQNENNFKLSIIKDGERKFISKADFDADQYDEIEGIVIVLGDQSFIIKLHNEQSDWVNKDTAMSMYSDILPDKTQASIISMMHSDINNALINFGGEAFKYGSGYHYMTKTAYDSEYNYQIYLYQFQAGVLAGYSYNSTYGYIRGVININ
ncbi:MAG: hypothetical protein K2H49_00305, partial [Muribaculaceae bacterium]|nr:hypothetical protein [Muribaculaceae bacterium]